MPTMFITRVRLYPLNFPYPAVTKSIALYDHRAAVRSFAGCHREIMPTCA